MSSLLRLPGTASSRARELELEPLLEMLTYRRPAGSDTEAAWCRRYLKPLGARQDQHGNYVLAIGAAPTIAWSSHTDTVHREEGRQRVVVTGDVVAVKKSNCLGADCTAGAWLMREMVLAQIPGLYLWHYGEERGCIGSNALAAHNPGFLDGTEHVIAFDRRGADSVVTHQCGLRTCSDAFAREVAARLDMNLHPDPTGVYTDSNSYAHLVPECTNISVGYEHAHTADECLDLAYLVRLRDAILAADWAGLPIARDPAEFDLGYGEVICWGESDGWNDAERNEHYKLVDLISEYPEVAAQLLADYGMSSADFAEECYGK